MSRPFNFPDPRDVRVGNPTFLASRELVLNLYNQSNPESAATNYCQRVKEWFIQEALDIGWSNALEAGNNLGILLHLNVQIPQFIPQTPLLPQ